MALQFAMAFEDGQTVHFQALATTRAWKAVDICLQRRGLNKHSHRAFYQMEEIDSHQTIAEVFGEPGDASGLCSDPIQIFAERSGGEQKGRVQTCLVLSTCSLCNTSCT